MFFFHAQDLASFTNTLTELFNRNMNTQILLMAVKEDSNIKDFFEQIFKIFKEMQSAAEEMHSKMQKEPLCSKVAMAICSVVEKSTNVKELHQSAKEVLRNIHTPAVVSVLSNGNIFGSEASYLSLLMKSPIMNLQLSDFHRENTKEQSDATTSEKAMGPGPSKNAKVDILKKLQDALKTVNNPTESAADLLEQSVNAMRSVYRDPPKSHKDYGN
ncbi:uncharacterized protein C12orf60 homolog [Cynocephalus volans]|uniref:uncharacterized protein C12orf60 homolog n=1 Tax=Cynocephalus volans TaxID=110931 RepID=UPI002FCC948D